jgi:hypothetical protein
MQSASFITLPLRYRVALHYTTFHSFQLHSFQPIASPHSSSLSSFHFTSPALFSCLGICHCLAALYLVGYRQITKYSYTTFQIHNPLQRFTIANFIQSGTCFSAMLLLNTLLHFPVAFNPLLRCKKWNCFFSFFFFEARKWKL